MGCLLHGLTPRARGKHVRWLFSARPQESHLIEHDQVPVVPDKVLQNFLQVQGPRLRKHLPFDSHDGPEARKHKVLNAIFLTDLER